MQTNIVNLTWTGASGRAYQFQLDPIGATYQDIAGVYIFCYLANDNRWYATYIGESDSLWRRLSDQLTYHHKWQSICASGATHICTLHVPGSLALREAIETDLRHSNPTPCNDQ